MAKLLITVDTEGSSIVHVAEILSALMRTVAVIGETSAFYLAQLEYEAEVDGIGGSIEHQDEKIGAWTIEPASPTPKADEITVREAIIASLVDGDPAETIAKYRELVARAGGAGDLSIDLPGEPIDTHEYIAELS